MAAESVRRRATSREEDLDAISRTQRTPGFAAAAASSARSIVPPAMRSTACRAVKAARAAGRAPRDRPCDHAPAGCALRSRHVIARPIPAGREDERAAALLARCLKDGLRLALSSIAFPAIATGIYGYPLDEAARVAIGAVAGALRNHRSPRLVPLRPLRRPRPRSLRRGRAGNPRLNALRLGRRAAPRRASLVFPA